MPRNRMTVVWTALAALALSAPARAADWPQWRGPERTGVSPETGLLQEWPKGGPKLLWKATGLGEGYSTPAVAGGRIYLLGTRGQNEYAFDLDAKDGHPLWATKIGAVGKDGPPSYPGPRATPTVDGNRLYVLGSDGDLACLDTAGRVVWQKNLAQEFGEGRGRWAYSESPLIDGDVLVCTPGSAKASLAALNKKTGAVIWTSEIPEAGEAAYASAIVAEAGGVKQYVQLLRKGMVGVAAKDGKPLWRFDKTATPTNCSTPIFHDGYIYSAALGPGGGGTALLRLGADGIEQVYLNKGLMNHHGGVVRVGDYVYGTTGRTLVCQEFKTGKVIWEDRSVGKGSVSAADGRLYVRGENGQVALVEATPDGYREKGRFDQPDRSQQPAWPHPVIAGGRLYLRDGDILLCYDIRAR